jgi:serine/threonine protein kinase/membrane-associated phospholipid phosphatase
MTAEPAPRSLSPGTTTGHYTILSPLGRGGMGEVYLAHDTKLDRKVAIKVLPEKFAADHARLRRFELEARALAALNHPNIVSIFSIEEAAGRHLLVMELVEGRTLRELIRPAGMSTEAFLEIAVSLADAIAAAHASGLMHRDLKPENIMVTASGRVKVLDFGLAKFGETGVSSADNATTVEMGLTLEGIALGTVPYMSPEQAEGGTIDPRSDIFSLGIVFHEMLTGRQPFAGKTLAQVFTAILRDDPPALRESRADLPADFDQLLRRCLSKRPDARFSSGVELHQALRQLSGRIHSNSASPSTLAALPLAMPASEAEALDAEAAPVHEAFWRALDSRWGLTATLVALSVINWIQTTVEDAWSVRRGSWIGYDFAAAFNWFEGGLTFERHELAGPVVVYLGSIAYFFLPAALLAATVAVLIPRRTMRAYRVFTFAILVCYAVSVPFYIFLPVPERWAYPESQAILLSDLWSTRLIELIRPISGLDNCFPSFHVSGTVALALVWYVFRVPFRHAVAWLAAAVVLSTLVLGIHWVADVIGGLALGVVSVWLAMRMDGVVRNRLAGTSVALGQPIISPYNGGVRSHHA